MLSIRFDSNNEWWVSGRVLTRVFETSLNDGTMPKRLEEWLHVADANGGLDLSQIGPNDAAELKTALYSTAEREVQRLRAARPTTEDGSYRISLEKLLALDKSGRLKNR
jgi:hypothetical protein